LAETRYLQSGQLSRDGLKESRDKALVFGAFNPAKISTGEGGQKVTQLDRMPYFVAGIMAMMLWLAVFSGAYMLLTSMLEEKLNKLLEMMLASTHFSEIIVGKLIGVAALTMTAMLPYLVIGIGGVIAIILFGDAETGSAIKQAFTWKMAVFFPLFLVLGYLFYGALFIAMGALAESMQDAQTITTPIVIVLTLCVLVVPMGIKNPDSAILIFASWFPLSAPFAAIARLPSDPPFWELALSAGFLALLSVGVIMLAGRVFRYGVLSGAGVKGAMAWIKRVIFRRKSA
jgi:ABC-2 type transport system permease protein